MAFDFDLVRPMFGGKLTQEQVDGINTICAAWGYGAHNGLAYLLATAKHETADTMQPIHERGAKAYFAKYEPTTKIGKALGNTTAGDGYRYRGRGYVQLTGRANYRKAGNELGIDLVKEPERALEPAIAAKILIEGCVGGWFTGKKLADYIKPGKADYVNARRVVNGTDRAVLIAGYADAFARALQGLPAATPTPAEPEKPPTAPAGGKATAFGWGAAILFVISAILKLIGVTP